LEYRFSWSKTQEVLPGKCKHINQYFRTVQRTHHKDTPIYAATSPYTPQGHTNIRRHITVHTTRTHQYTQPHHRTHHKDTQIYAATSPHTPQEHTNTRSHITT
jgi:hypothetical protein